MLKNINLTPLSLIIAASITYAFYCLLGYEIIGGISIYASFGYCLVLAFVLFLSDLLFRKFIPHKKKLWITETSFILLIFTLIIIFKK
ncbi:MAG: hypothetical protein EAZ51_09080 [Sphingobacteriales bacterium]|nr:MAG: hypothetical protein EAZ64_07315 [Sphingobacteriales bacterium]TAF78641.1 MAG: hypothetical protein EAZ51_09080 [Sphingobacteriales bacterium]